MIRTIGDPRVRFREDPVRILRAAKFAARLGFTVEPETFAAMAETSGDLVRSAPPRLLEEILRLNPDLDPQTLRPGQRIRLRQ